MSKFQFTDEQKGNLQRGKLSLNTEKALNWAAEEEKAEIATSAILNDDKFKNGENLSPEKLDELFRNMKWFSANRNLSNLLYRTNGLENFWSLLKRGISGTYVSVEPFHLFRYLDEQTYRYNNRKLTDGERFSIAVSGIAGKRLTFAELTGKLRQEAF